MASAHSDSSSTSHYAALKRAVSGLPLPTCVLELDALEKNAQNLLMRAGALPVRLCSKSIRSVGVLRHVQQLSTRFQGVLCYSAREAAWLATLGFQDLLVAYPTVDRAELDAACSAISQGHTLTLMVDHTEQLAAIAARAREHGVVAPVCIDLDLSSDFPLLYFGVRRSPVRSAREVVALAQQIATEPCLRLTGLMGYEAQLAGPQDALPHDKLKSALLRGLKQLSNKQLQARRAEAVRALREAGHSLRFVNGGGTGSLERTREDHAVTEVAAGSGLYAPTLFEHFSAFQLEPALFFALPVVRKAAPDIITCAGGGYVASGPAGLDRSPRPVLPQGLELLPHEGAGEVQTPLRITIPHSFVMGDPVFFRHAKAGELLERFLHIALVRDAALVGELTSYRGDGQCFF